MHRSPHHCGKRLRSAMVELAATSSHHTTKAALPLDDVGGGTLAVIWSYP